MRKKFVGVMLVTAMAVGLAGCGGSGGASTGAMAADTQATKAQKEEAEDSAKKEDEKEDSGVSDSEGISDFHIGTIAGSVSQSGDDRRDAEALRAMYGKGMVKLAIYPDNFTEELETTIQTIVNPSDDSKMKTIITNQFVPGTTEAFHKTKETRSDILCITGGGYEDLLEIGSATDLICGSDFATRGYLIIHITHEFGCGTFVYISSLRHIAYETMSRRVAIMKRACRESGMGFVLKTAPDPTSDAGVAGAQAYVLEKVPERIEKYGKDTAYFCTNDAHTEPLLRQFVEYGDYSIEVDPPPPLISYPDALSIDLTAEAGNFDRILAKVKSTAVERGDADHLRTWAYSYGYTTSANLAQHALNILNGESELDDADDIAKTYQVFSPKAEQNGSNYTNAEAGVKLDNVSPVYQGTYIMSDSGHFMGSTKIKVSEKYFIIK